jgi:hypothetical protein
MYRNREILFREGTTMSDVHERQILKLRQLLLLTDPSVSDVIVGDTQLRQWDEYVRWMRELEETPTKQPKNTRIFKEWIFKSGHVSTILATEDFKSVTGEDMDIEYFLQWTGREFKISVDW